MVYVDIDPSEMGRTGGEQISAAARLNLQRMNDEGAAAIENLAALGVQVGGSRKVWHIKHGLSQVVGDRDVAAFHPSSRRCVIAEVEGASSGQPEQKLYKAIGQLVMAVGEIQFTDWRVDFVLVAHGEAMARHITRASALKRLGVSVLLLSPDQGGDQWIIGSAPHSSTPPT